MRKKTRCSLPSVLQTLACRRLKKTVSSVGRGAFEPSHRAAPRPLPPAGAVPMPPRGPPTTSSHSSAVRLLGKDAPGRRHSSSAREDALPASPRSCGRRGDVRGRISSGESSSLLGARCAAAARNPRSNMSRVKVLDFTRWQEQWPFVRAALCATRMMSLARSSIGEISQAVTGRAAS